MAAAQIFHIPPPSLDFKKGILIMNFKKGVLIINRHNVLRGGAADLARKVFTPLHVSNNPLIYQCRAVQEGNAQPEGSPPQNPTENIEK